MDGLLCKISFSDGRNGEEDISNVENFLGGEERMR